jgi:hypothetical protein
VPAALWRPWWGWEQELDQRPELVGYEVARSLKSRARSNRSGARGSRVRLLHGLTGTKADRRRRRAPPIFICSGRPDRPRATVAQTVLVGLLVCGLAGMAMVGVGEIGLVRAPAVQAASSS